MKNEEWTSEKTGKTGTTITLEAGDKFMSEFPTYRTSNFGGYDNYSLAVKTPESEEVIYVKITPAQKKQIDAIGDIQMAEMEAYEYESKNYKGKFVGIRLVKKVEEKKEE